ncbi:hypothetical protein F441_18648 [Phytophthora nicotianae CJ01A1]|uniref:Uncharacterized protein n=3 Tax=Phytophthora nicotianae TaxID=4792 RepID=W2PJK3_PHYN3|nr:hypothetical protein PPTG_24117 [Phytophthora nicotianae INRA-310]ETI34790.1 hypothetical protein F443_18797 [Phytophthora nicotianae P1569]ETN01203.1 hypothetical protein PPTG_24117 [Phytophthora nicotianae INRA-310]ETP04641.1 hypothetical protein F441_18648 [Phytophthora nicotianae CJ01A1]
MLKYLIPCRIFGLTLKYSQLVLAQSFSAAAMSPLTSCSLAPRNTAAVLPTLHQGVISETSVAITAPPDGHASSFSKKSSISCGVSAYTSVSIGWSTFATLLPRPNWWSNMNSLKSSADPLVAAYSLLGNEGAEKATFPPYVFKFKYFLITWERCISSDVAQDGMRSFIKYSSHVCSRNHIPLR